MSGLMEPYGACCGQQAHGLAREPKIHGHLAVGVQVGDLDGRQLTTRVTDPGDERWPAPGRVSEDGHGRSRMMAQSVRRHPAHAPDPRDQMPEGCAGRRQWAGFVPERPRRRQAS